MNAEDRSHKPKPPVRTGPPSRPPVPHAAEPSPSELAPVDDQPPTWTIATVCAAVGLGVPICMGMLLITVLLVRTSDEATGPIGDEQAEPQIVAAVTESADLPTTPIVPRTPPKQPAREPFSRAATQPAPVRSPSPLHVPVDRTEPPTAEAGVDESPLPAALPDPFQDIRARQNCLPLPALQVLEGVGTFARLRPNTQRVELAKLPVQAPLSCRLRLGGNEFAPSSRGLPMIHTIDEQTRRRWEVVTRTAAGLGEEGSIKIATFSLEEGVLHFNWETDQPPLRLALCTLEIVADGHSVTCTFEVPAQTVPTATLPSQTGGRIELLSAGDSLLQPGDQVGVQVKLRGIAGAVQADTWAALTPTLTPDNAQVKFSVPVRDAKATIELRLVDTVRMESLGIEVRLLGEAEMLHQDSPRSSFGYARSVAWRRVSQPMALNGDAVEAHRDKARQDLQQFSATLRKSFGIKQFNRWADESAATRKAVVDEYAKLATALMEIQARRNRGFGPLGDPDELKEQIQALVKEHPKAPQLYLVCALQNPTHLELARHYNLFAEFVEDIERWADAMQQFLQNLSDEAHLDYRLFVTVDGREIDLVVTEGFSSSE